MFKLLLALSALVSLSSSQQFREDNFEISDSNANSCETIVEASRFDGDCCSLNSTDAGGCVLNIVNGRCKVCEESCCFSMFGVVFRVVVVVIGFFLSSNTPIRYSQLSLLILLHYFCRSRDNIGLLIGPLPTSKGVPHVHPRNIPSSLLPPTRRMLRRPMTLLRMALLVWGCLRL